MITGRRWTMAVAALLALTGATAAAAQDKGAPVPRSPAENVCRSACGAAWVEARSCRAEAEVCLRRADQSYRQCLPDCAVGKAPKSAAFAWFYTAPPRASVRRDPVTRD